MLGSREPWRERHRLLGCYTRGGGWSGVSSLGGEATQSWVRKTYNLAEVLLSWASLDFFSVPDMVYGLDRDGMHG